MIMWILCLCGYVETLVASKVDVCRPAVNN